MLENIIVFIIAVLISYFAMSFVHQTLAVGIGMFVSTLYAFRRVLFSKGMKPKNYPEKTHLIQVGIAGLGCGLGTALF